jgi:hypothetical protein
MAREEVVEEVFFMMLSFLVLTQACDQLEPQR